MKKIVISGSVKLEKEVNYWVNFFEEKNYDVIDYPRKIDKSRFMELYPDIHKEFFVNITNTNVLFIMNTDKDEKVGYIGSETFAELTFGLSQKLIFNKNIEIVLLKMPCKEVQCYEEIKLWLSFGWIKLYE